jgi:hypothetical protein
MEIGLCAGLGDQFPGFVRIDHAQPCRIELREVEHFRRSGRRRGRRRGSALLLHLLGVVHLPQQLILVLLGFLLGLKPGKVLLP